MIDLYDLYQSFKSYVNTYAFGWFRPQSDFMRACNDISIELFVKWTGMAEKSQEAKDNLFPFLVSTNMIVTASGPYGFFKKPDNTEKPYSRYAAARVIISDNGLCLPDKEVNDGKCSNGDFKTEEQISDEYYDSVKQITVDLIDDKKWGSVMVHATKGPKMTSPKIRQINGGFQVAPRGISVIVIDYYRQPKQATFIFTTTTGNIQNGTGDDMVYDPKNNKPLEWPDNLRDEFLINLGERYGLFTRDSFVSNMAAQRKNTA